ncbi:hypothetical protein BH10PSE2_BH10PSE2_23650 [soil metagenome]
MFAPLLWLAGLVATVAALTLGAILAVFTAAAVAVIALCASVLVFFAGFAVRAHRRVSPARRATDTADDLIEARKVGDTWVTYGWERRAGDARGQ